jgi:ubiquinone/menaquinone biosynthesis C-methylase UbiE
MPKATLPNDFERMIPEYHKGSLIYGEHIVRYEACKNLVKGKIVLDIASGSGYGTAILSEQAKKVYGVDVSKDSIAYAKEHYGAKNIDYLVGDGNKIPLQDSSVDVVITFETIEHIEDYEGFLYEIKRVLKPEGLLILSTPNDLEFAEGNHFHVHEFTYKELHKLVKKHFKHVEAYFQGTWTYTALLPEKLIATEWSQSIQTSNVAPLSLDKALYFFLICSTQKTTANLELLGAISGHYSERKIQEKNKLTDKHIQNLQDIAENRQKEIEFRDNRIKDLEDKLSKVMNSLPGKIMQKTSSFKARITLKK